VYTPNTNRSTVHLQGLSALLDSSVLRRRFSYQCMGGLRVSSHSSNSRLATCPCPCLWARVTPLDLLSIRYIRVRRRCCRLWPSNQCMEDLRSHRRRHLVSINQPTEDLHSHRLHNPGLLLEVERHPSVMPKQLARARSKPSPCMSVARTFNTTTSKHTTKGSLTCG
jgi:hypothetical protein